MRKRKERLARTPITPSASFNEKMSQADGDSSEIIREMLDRRLGESQPDLAEAVTLNQRVKNSAPKEWSSSEVIKQWRRRTSS